MYHFHEFVEWRQMDITAELLNNIAEVATEMAAKVVNSDSFDGDRDQYLKGFIAGLSSVSGWKPEFIPEENRSPEDALK